jgi:hypothetical protein
MKNKKLHPLMLIHSSAHFDLKLLVTVDTIPYESNANIIISGELMFLKNDYPKKIALNCCFLM